MKHQNEKLQFSIRTLLQTLDGEALVDLIKQYNHADIAEVLSQHKSDKVLALLMTLAPEQRAELFSELSSDLQNRLLNNFPLDELADLFEALPSDDRSTLFNRLSEEKKDKLLPEIEIEQREDIVNLAAYKKGTVGSVTTSSYVLAKPEDSAQETIDMLRNIGKEKETIYVVYVLDESKHLLGTVSLRDLLLAQPELKIRDIMQSNPIFARASWDREKAAELIRRYDFLAVPVINDQNKMVGIVTVDDAMDIEKEVDAAAMTSFGGTASLGGPDLDLFETSYKKMVGVRLFWLAILVFFGAFTSTFVAGQEEILSEVIILAAFIAPIIDMGGNTGSQSATLVIRAMALGQVKICWRDMWKIFRRELSIVVLIGIIIAVLEITTAVITKNVGYEVMMTVGLSMFACTALGGIIGCLLPFLARKIGTDPATLSSPLITSIMDLAGVMIYFGFAYIFLADILLASATASGVA